MLRSHGCGELDRGLQNLDSLPAREGFFVILFVSNKKYVKVFKGFNWVCANLLFGCADSRFAEPRISFWEGFNFVRAKPPLRRAESRFGKPRNSRKGERIGTFCGVQKVPQKHAEGCDPLDSGDDSNRRSIRCFCESDRRSSGNRFCEKLQLRRVSPAMI